MSGRALLAEVLVNLVRSVRPAAAVPAQTAVPSPGQASWAIVLGCGVRPSGHPSLMLADRVDHAVSLARTGQVTSLLMTGDGSSASGFDETAVMRERAIGAGIAADRIVCDPEGLSTFASLARARTIVASGRCLVVTQPFHVPRTAYLAAALLDRAEVVACGTDRRYDHRLLVLLSLREVPASFKAIAQVRRASRASRASR